jgi:hypothetical protein
MNSQYNEWMSHLSSLPVVALITTGRTGSDFLQSLLDSHPQVATFNGHFAIYTEFFENSVTISYKKPRVCDVADEFIGKYIYKLVSRYDIQEAKDELGINSDQSFTIDTAEFKKHMIFLMKDYAINSRNILLSIYGAYSLCIGQDILKLRTIMHHPHLDFEFDKFHKDFPGTRIIFTSRDPRANFCSHVEHFKKYYSSHNNQRHLYNCLKMALEDSEIADSYKLEYTATRLEDLPRKDVMQKLAEWFNIKYSDSMLRSTWVGLDWHGDRISNKVFSSTGWSKDRVSNGWEEKLGVTDKYILNYILNSRLKHYLYPVKNVGIIDSFIVFFLIVFPLKYERNFAKYSYIKDRIVNGKGSQLIYTPIYYLKRVVLCYKYYFRTLKKVKFSRNWIGLE